MRAKHLYRLALQTVHLRTTLNTAEQKHWRLTWTHTSAKRVEVDITEPLAGSHIGPNFPHYKVLNVDNAWNIRYFPTIPQNASNTQQNHPAHALPGIEQRMARADQTTRAHPTIWRRMQYSRSLLRYVSAEMSSAGFGARREKINPRTEAESRSHRNNARQPRRLS